MHKRKVIGDEYNSNVGGKNQLRERTYQEKIKLIGRFTQRPYVYNKKEEKSLPIIECT
jgi:hypothetical protein